MTELTPDGLRIDAQDLSAISPDSEDDKRMFHHNGSSSINLTGGGSTTTRGFYIYDDATGKWSPNATNADLLDGKEAGAFLHRDGSLAMEADLDAGHNGLLNTDSVESGVGKLLLNSNHVKLKALSSGADLRLEDNNGLLLLNAQEGGNVDMPNGTLSEQGNRVATRQWTLNNADVPNADYADDAGTLGGLSPSAFLQVSGDQMEGKLDLGANNIEDGSDVLWDAVNSEVPQGTLGGPAASLSAYPLAAGDLAEDYAVTSRFPLPASDLAENYVLTSRLPLPAGDLAEDYAVTSRFPIPNSDVANSDVTVTAGNQLTGGGSVSLGGSITVGVDENNLNADTLDGAEKADLDSQYVDESGDTMSGPLTLGGKLDLSASDLVDGTTTVWDTSVGEVPQAVLGGPASSLSSYPLANSDLSNSTVTVAGNAVGLGGSTGVALGDLSNVTASGEGSGNGFDADLLDGAHKSDLDSQYVDGSGDTMDGQLTLNGAQVKVDQADPAYFFEFNNTTTTSSMRLRVTNSDKYVFIPGDPTNGDVWGKEFSWDVGTQEWQFAADNVLMNGDLLATQAWVDAKADVPNADYADSAGDADTLDGEQATAFADTGHQHDGRYVLEGGDTMTGVLTLSDGSTAASQSWVTSNSTTETWVNNNADVPNADYADSAGDADTLDGEHATAFSDAGHTHGEDDLTFDAIPVSIPVTKYADALSDVEIYRIELQAGETLEVDRLEIQPKGGGDVTGLNVDVFDETNSTVIASTNDLATGSPVGSSGNGASVIVRLTNSSGSYQYASIGGRFNIV